MSMRFMITLALCGACAADTGESLDEEKGRGDWRAQHRMMSDATFQDTAITEHQLQLLLQNKPTLRGTEASWLASARIGNGSFAARLVQIAAQHKVNPLVLLAWLQMNAGLVSKPTAPTIATMSNALSCACPAGQRCGDGLEGQLQCLGLGLRADFDKAAARQPVAIQDGSRRTLAFDEPVGDVAPMNRSMVAILARLNLNLESADLFYAVFQQYITQLEDATGSDFDRFRHLPSAEGFIGGACQYDSDCLYAGGVCRPTSDNKRLCTLSCETGTLCPDRLGAPTTYCVSSSTLGMSGSAAYCTSQCAAGSACTDGFECRSSVPRFGQTLHTRNVCISNGRAVAPPTTVCMWDYGCGEPVITPTPTVDPNGLWSIRIVDVSAPPKDKNGEYWDGYLASYLPDMSVRMAVGPEPCQTPGHGCHNESTSYGSDALTSRLEHTLFPAGLTVSEIQSGIRVVVRDHDFDGPMTMSTCTLRVWAGSLISHVGVQTLECGQGQDEDGNVKSITIRYEVKKIEGAFYP